MTGKSLHRHIALWQNDTTNIEHRSKGHKTMSTEADNTRPLIAELSALLQDY